MNRHVLVAFILLGQLSRFWTTLSLNRRSAQVKLLFAEAMHEFDPMDSDGSGREALCARHTVKPGLHVAMTLPYSIVQVF